MLLYSLLHLTRVKAVNRKYEQLGELSVPLEEIKRFRQLGSKCPGHPEYRWTSGVETSTGPLGQGLANSVGMAVASRWLAARYNTPDFTMFDFDVYALCGDGCMMEGISHEAASLAGHWKLSKLCWIYDSNRITIEGHTSSRLQRGRCDAVYGLWLERDSGRRCQRSRNGRAGIQGRSRSTRDRPTLIIVDSHIALGRTKQAGHKRRPRRAFG